MKTCRRSEVQVFQYSDFPSLCVVVMRAIQELFHCNVLTEHQKSLRWDARMYSTN